MTSYLWKVKSKLDCFRSYNVQQIPREHNSIADALACPASTMNKEVADSILVKCLQNPSICAHEHVVMATSAQYSWMDPIIAYLVMPDDKNEARTSEQSQPVYFD